MMHTKAQAVWDTIEAGERTAQQWRRKSEYTPEAQATAALAARRKAAQEALQSARKALQDAQGRRDAAQARLQDAQRSALANVNTQRQMLVAERARAMAGDVGALLGVVNEATDLGDMDLLRAARDFVLPALKAAIGKPVSMAWAAPKLTPGMWARVARDVDQAIAGAEPEDLKAARQEAQAADDDLGELAGDLRRVNDRLTDKGGPGLLAPLMEASEVGITSGSIESGRFTIGPTVGAVL